MSSFPGSPRTMPGAIVAVDPLSPLARTVIFQYNPDEVTRSLRPRAAAERRQLGVRRAPDLGRAHREHLDDGRARRDGRAGERRPAGSDDRGRRAARRAGDAALPQHRDRSSTNAALLLAGTIEVLPPEAPLTVLVWGPGRVVPVRVESLDDPRAGVRHRLSCRSGRASTSTSTCCPTTTSSPTDPGFALFLVHQVLKETMASVAAVASVAGAAASAVGGSASGSVSIGG